MGGVVSAIFSKPKAPSVPAAPTPPKVSDAGPAARSAAVKAKKRYGRQATILTGGQGLTEEAEIEKKTLLGA